MRIIIRIIRRVNVTRLSLHYRNRQDDTYISWYPQRALRGQIRVRCVSFGQSGRLELGDNILRTL